MDDPLNTSFVNRHYYKYMDDFDPDCPTCISKWKAARHLFFVQPTQKCKFFSRHSLTAKMQSLLAKNNIIETNFYFRSSFSALFPSQLLAWAGCCKTKGHVSSFSVFYQEPDSLVFSYVGSSSKPVKRKEALDGNYRKVKTGHRTRKPRVSKRVGAWPLSGH